MDLEITSNAIERIQLIRQQKSQDSLMLRVTVEGGGCSGFQYNLTWDTEKTSEDTCFSDCVLIDNMSLSILKGSKVDFVSGLMGEDFKIINPNAVSSCGCGTSFSI